jgi:hypothetical protein
MGDSMSTIINATTTNGVVIQPDNSGSLVLQTNSGTTALTIDTSQNVAFAKGFTVGATAAPAFRAYQSTAQSTLTANVETKILLQTEDWDTNSNFASSRFTPTVAGYYQINGSVQINGTTAYLVSILYKNGSVYKYGTYIPTSLDSPVSVVSDVVYFNGSNDYIELYAGTGTSLATTAGTRVTTLSGSLVRSA